MLDLTIILATLTVPVLIGVYLRRGPQSIQNYLLGGRSMGTWVLGTSLTTAFVGGLMFLELPGQAYYRGLQLLALPLAVWIVIPLATQWFLPLYHRLGSPSVFEYLEFRFDRVLRMVVCAAFVALRILWLAVLLTWTCQLLTSAAGWRIPTWLLIGSLGLTVTVYTVLGGIKAVLWSDVIQRAKMQRMRDVQDYHSDVRQAAETATRCGVGTLVLNHLVPAPSPDQEADWIAMAAEAFDGRILVARDLLSVSG